MKIIKNDKAFVLTGGPGMGKTSVVDHLKSMRYKTVKEYGRDIIQQQLALGGRKLPWKDSAGFALEMYRQARKDFESTASNKHLHTL
ncbi:AAA family ATPase [Flavobacterium bizetiae]|uniref:AAA family ATPase n=1 Tax=Flavobacterium bizetiae TaxID=2704140 RepID=UPI003756306E